MMQIRVRREEQSEKNYHLVKYKRKKIFKDNTNIIKGYAGLVCLGFMAYQPL